MVSIDRGFEMNAARSALSLRCESLFLAKEYREIFAALAQAVRRFSGNDEGPRTPLGDEFIQVVAALVQQHKLTAAETVAVVTGYLESWANAAVQDERKSAAGTNAKA